MRVNIIHDCMEPTMGGIESFAYYLLLEFDKLYDVGGFSVDYGFVENRSSRIYYALNTSHYKYDRFEWLKDRCKACKDTINVAMTWQSAIPCFFVNGR